MARFQYKGLDSQGKKVKGSMNAGDKEELYQKLRETGIFLTNAKEESNKKNRTRINENQLSEFCRSLGTYLKAGITLVQALEILSREETIKPAHRKIYKEVLKYVRQGGHLSDAMEEQGGVFPEMLIQMIRSAEVAGNMAEVCSRMAVHYEKEYRTKTKIKGAMMYPTILLVLTVIVVILVFTYIIPQFADLFSEMSDLPTITKIVMGISNIIKGYWYLFLLAIPVVYVIITTVMQIRAVRIAWDHFKLKVPIAGKLLKTIYTARFARTLCSLYTSGLPIVNALQIARSTLGNAYIDSQFDKVVANIKAGGNLSEAVGLVDGFSLKLVSSIKIGEETGSLDTMLESMADMLDYEADEAIVRLITLLEPLMIVFMAIIIGTVLISIILPIYGSYDAIGAEA